MKYIFCLYLFFSFLFCSCDEREHNTDLQIDPNLPDKVNVRYEVIMDQPELFYLSITYTNGRTYFDFINQYYVNTDGICINEYLDTDFWEHEFSMDKGAILYVAANVVSKENVSAVKPANVIVKIYVNDELIKEQMNQIHSSCEFIYGAKKQNENFYLFT